MSTSKTIELNLLRRAHVGAARRAALVSGLVEEMRRLEVVLPYKETLEYLASAIFFNASYDACERYESVGEFADSLEDDLKSKYSERRSVDGVDCLVLRPFFADDYGFLTHLRMDYLRGCDPKELRALHVETPELTDAEPTGLTEAEVDALIAFHRGATLKLVNKLRHVSTAMHYVTYGLRDLAEDKQSTHPKHTMDSRAAGLAAELVTAVDMPFTPAPSKHFGTDADRVNTLRELAADAAALKPLLDWA